MTSITMTREEVLKLYDVFKELSQIHNTRFAYFIAKNKKLLQSEIEIINEIRRPPEKYLEFERKRLDLVAFHSEKNENGDPIIQNGHFKVVDESLFSSAFKSLSKEYAEALIDAEKHEDSLKEFLSESVDFDVLTIPFKYLPDTLNSSEIESLMSFIEDEPDTSNS